MNTPTDQQSALVRETLEGKRMSCPSRFDQEMLFAIYKANYTSNKQ
ncbi:hypothetical protein PN465_02240 [Nodularia spumigena CS-584]|nr:hypothetical protein [Nodularia spumigena]AHJ29419.1 hypothetical protein NSP_30920 [Nodularia spumigena CCY9414]MDB9381060.1 hypothetical protein [Nodularia spumigena CS-584]MEA5525374.1 hypothetical protein [Nodularia spumigena UHCC 0143]